MINSIVVIVLLAVLAVWSIHRAFFTQPGTFGSWAMYSHIAYYRVDLEDTSGRSISSWEYEVPGSWTENLQSLASLTSYLKDERGIEVSGSGTFAGVFGYEPVIVDHGKVICVGIGFESE